MYTFPIELFSSANKLDSLRSKISNERLPFHTASVAGRGHVALNTFNQNLIVSTPELIAQETAMPIDLGLCCNSIAEKENYWRFKCLSTIKKSDSTSELKIVDVTGSEITFTKKFQGARFIADKDSSMPSAYIEVLSDKNTLRMHDPESGNYDDYDNKSLKLKSRYSSNGQSLNFTYDLAGRLQSITSSPFNHEYVYTYNNGKIELDFIDGETKVKTKLAAYFFDLNYNFLKAVRLFEHNENHIQRYLGTQYGYEQDRYLKSITSIDATMYYMTSELSSEIEDIRC